MRRRSFLKTAAVAALPVAASTSTTAVAAASKPGESTPSTTGNPGEMKYRDLGRTGEKVSILGLGGYHIGMPKEEGESIALIRAAIDGGITFMDNC